MWDAFWAIAFKETLQLTRDKKKLRRVFMLQAMTFLMIASIDVTIQRAPTVVVDQDRTADSRELSARLSATRTFDIKYVTSSTEQARGHIRAGRAKVAVIIPPDYSRLRAAGNEAHILALVDGSDSNSSTQVVAALEGVTTRMNTDAQLDSIDATPDIGEVTAHTGILYNPRREVSFFMLPGTLAIMLGFAYTRMIVMGLVSEREAGNLERLLMTPMDYKGLILGKLLPFFVIGLLNAIAYVTVIHFAFGVPVNGSVLVLLAGLTLYLLTVLSLGSFIAAGAATSSEALTLWMFLTFPSMMLSGYIFPLSSVPKVLLPVSYAMPQTHFIEIMRGVCLRGASAGELLPHLLFLGIAPVLLTLGAAYRFKNSVMD